uniref:GWxTD domain-containing protein n=1 Tax=candidate division WOR-3 bacterium TaxID=2052148 RepID=A0A7V4CHP3_UNCW3
MIALLFFFNFFALDYSIFWAEDPFSFVEFYYSLPLFSLSPEKIVNDTAFFSYSINFSIRGKITKKEKLEKKIFLPNYSYFQNLNKIYIDGFGLYLPFGNYFYQIEFLGNKYQDSLKIKDFQNKTGISSLLYLISCGKEEKNGNFYRNGYYYTPNPERIYNLDKDSIAYLYFELYNLVKDTIFIGYQIFDEEGRLEKDFSLMKIVKDNKNLAKAIGIPLKSLSSGRKTLSLFLTDGKEKIEEEKKDFYLISEKETALLLRDSLFIIKESLFYLLERNKKEKEKYRKMSLLGKKKYLDNYFRVFNLDTLRARIDYVNLHYSYMKKKGVETDRGRVYLKYGEPEKKEIEIFGIDIRPYEYWYYSQTNYFYLFMDIHGDGNYLLLYTNDPKESIYPNYEKYLNYEIMEKLGIKR